MYNMNQQNYNRVTGSIFLVIFALHAARLVFGWDAFVNYYEIPLWLSVVAAVLSGYLSFAAFRAK